MENLRRIKELREVDEDNERQFAFARQMEELAEQARTQVDSESRQRRREGKTGELPQPSGKDVLPRRQNERADEP